METGFLDVRAKHIRSVTAEQLLAGMLEEHGKPDWNPRGRVARPTLADSERLHAVLVDTASSLRPILGIHPNVKLIPLWGVDAAGICTCRKKATCRTPGKHPRIEAWTNPEVGSTNVFTLATWLYRFGTGINWGVKTGLLEVTDRNEVHLAIVDVDTDDPGKQFYILEELEAQRTIVVRTQSGGLHLYYLSERGISNKTKFMLDVDTRGKGGQGVLPGSKGPKGVYSLATDFPWYLDGIEYLGREMERRIFSCSSASRPTPSRDVILQSPSHDLANGYDDIRPRDSLHEGEHQPDWQSRFVEPGSAKRLVEWIERGKPFRIPCGCRNTALMRIACYLRAHKAFGQSALRAFLEDMHARHLQSPETFGKGEITGIIKHAMKFPAKNAANRRWSAMSGEPIELTPEEEVFFLDLEKSGFFRCELREVVMAYQAMLVGVCGYKFAKAMDQNVVADVLRGLGFQKRRESVRGVDKYFWNVEPNSIPREFPQQLSYRQNLSGSSQDHPTLPVRRSSASIDFPEDLVATLTLPEPPTVSTEATGAVLSPGTFNVRGSLCAATFDVRSKGNWNAEGFCN